MDEIERQRQLKLKFEFEKRKSQMNGGLVHTPADNPAQIIKSNESFGAGATPGIADYAVPMGKMVSDIATFSQDQYPPTGNTSGGPFGSKMGAMTPEEKSDLSINLGSYSDKEAREVLSDLLRQNWQRDVQKNRDERAAAQKKDPTGYGLGQATTGAALGAGLGVAAGPEIAAQGLAGMGSGFAMDPTPESALLGGAAGAGIASGPQLLGKGLRSSGEALSNLSTTDAMIGDWLNLKSDEILALKQSGDWDELMQVVRANQSVSGPQAMRESIEMPAMARGAEGTSVNPMGQYPKTVGQVSAEMPPMSVSPQRPDLHPKSWNRPSGSREIDMSLAEPDQSLADFHGTDLYSNASTEDLVGLMPPHPAASQSPKGLPTPSGRPGVVPMARPQAQSTTLDMVQTGPNVPPLSPMERLASEKLGSVANRGQDLVHQTPTGMINRTLANRVAPMIGFKAPELGKKMLNLLDSQGAGMILGGLEGAGASKVRKAIGDMMQSKEPELTDYLYKEMFPEYNQLSLVAKDALEKESK